MRAVGVILAQHNLKGSAIINVLVTLMFLSLLLLSTQHWIKRQQQQTAILWQATQALQIAENQWNLRVIGENCEKIYNKTALFLISNAAAIR